ncbi:MAG: hypothetical protein GX273_09995 [Bacteroidales bacterium]|nr:hypothetical protein [Bacteroidales bacterium]
MNIVNIELDITTPEGKRLLQEIEKHPKVAKVKHELPPELVGKKLYTLKECYESNMEILSANYGVDVRKL